MTTAHLKEQLLDLLDDRRSQKYRFWLDRTTYERGAGVGETRHATRLDFFFFT
jgi:hypothetical protein